MFNPVKVFRLIDGHSTVPLISNHIEIPTKTVELYQTIYAASKEYAGVCSGSFVHYFPSIDVLSLFGRELLYNNDPATRYRVHYIHRLGFTFHIGSSGKSGATEVRVQDAISSAIPIYNSSMLYYKWLRRKGAKPDSLNEFGQAELATSFLKRHRHRLSLWQNINVP